ncbi:hypothetical protein HMPREF9134_00963 [Porphyromonas catoniae F0037]|uniref:Uncharacterized protein n=1 Tax=Porphyromonas catoniae F0037 TaxID=1127696 RepID=L1ND47_9PORP|nr:hypothetical protein HMPREF9134_00963 [Porphyromonas catoniae F0037]
MCKDTLSSPNKESLALFSPPPKSSSLSLMRKALTIAPQV